MEHVILEENSDNARLGQRIITEQNTRSIPEAITCRRAYLQSRELAYWGSYRRKDGTVKYPESVYISKRPLKAFRDSANDRWQPESVSHRKRLAVARYTPRIL